jgi:hypothetical protein
MSSQVPNKFTSYQLSEEELTAGYMLSPANVMVVRNELSIAAESKLALVVDPNNIPAFVQAEAYYRGKIDFIEWLLAMNDQVTKEHLDSAASIAEQDNGTVVTRTVGSIFT